MKRLFFGLTILVLGGCASATPSLPPGQTASHLNAQPTRHASWMLPQASQSASLLYVSLYSANDVNVYDYKNGVVGQLFGQLFVSGPAGMCTDQTGDVWIAPSYGPVQEYAHGGSAPIKLRNGIKGRPLGCAVDKTSGDLAISVYHDDSNYGMLTSVRIFGKGRLGHDFSIENGFGRIWSLAYDDKGNLFADGFQCGESECYRPAYYETALFELPKTASSFEQLKLQGATLSNPTGIAWINPTLLVADSDYDYSNPVGYKVLVHGQTATVVDTVKFSSAQSAGGLTVRAGSIVVPDQLGNTIWSYDLKTGGLESSFAITAPGDVVVSQKS
jgi:hypothetical protein